MLRLHSVCFGLAIVLLVAAAAQAQDFSFQEGEAGYTGTTDTTITSAQGDNNWGIREYMSARATAVPLFGLVKFDNIFGAGTGQIPASVTSADIANATLTAWSWFERVGAGDTSDLAVWPMTTPWVEGDGNNEVKDAQSSYNHRIQRTSGSYTAGTDFWGVATPTENAGPVFGEDVIGTLATPMDSFPSQARGVGTQNVDFFQNDFNVTDAVKAWIDGTYANEGFLLGGLTATNLLSNTLYYTRDAPVGTFNGRPLLGVTLVPEPSTLPLLLAGWGLALVISRRKS